MLKLIDVVSGYTDVDIIQGVSLEVYKHEIYFTTPQIELFQSSETAV